MNRKQYAKRLFPVAVTAPPEVVRGKPFWAGVMLNRALMGGERVQVEFWLETAVGRIPLVALENGIGPIQAEISQPGKYVSARFKLPLGAFPSIERVRVVAAAHGNDPDDQVESRAIPLRSP